MSTAIYSDMTQAYRAFIRISIFRLSQGCDFDQYSNNKFSRSKRFSVFANTRFQIHKYIEKGISLNYVLIVIHCFTTQC